MNCLLCSRDLTSKAGAVKCGHCKRSYHASCLDVSSDDLKNLVGRKATLKCSLCLNPEKQLRGGKIALIPTGTSTPTAVNKSSNIENLGKISCAECAKPCGKYTEQLKCCICNKHFHIDCVGISIAKFEAIRRRSDGLEGWYCGLCRGGAADFTEEESALDSSSRSVDAALIGIQSGESCANRSASQMLGTLSAAPAAVSVEDASNGGTCRNCDSLIAHFSAIIDKLERKICEEMTCFKKQLLEEMKTTLDVGLGDLSSKFGGQQTSACPSQGSCVSFAQVAASKSSVIIKPKNYLKNILSRSCSQLSLGSRSLG